MMMYQQATKRQRKPGVPPPTHGAGPNRYVGGTRRDKFSKCRNGLNQVRTVSRELTENKTRDYAGNSKKLVQYVLLPNVGIANKHQNACRTSTSSSSF